MPQNMGMTFVPINLCSTGSFHAHSLAWNSLISTHPWRNFSIKHLLHVPSTHIVPFYWHRHKSRFWLAKYLVESFCVLLAVCALTPFHPQGPQWQSALQGQQTIKWLKYSDSDLQKQTATEPSACITCHKKFPLDTAPGKTTLNCPLKPLLISLLT